MLDTFTGISLQKNTHGSCFPSFSTSVFFVNSESLQIQTNVLQNDFFKSFAYIQVNYNCSDKNRFSGTQALEIFCLTFVLLISVTRSMYES